MARKLNPKVWKKKCDTLWSRIIRARGSCSYCGAINVQLHAHHLIGKQSVFCRHNIDNGICLCAKHHSLGFEFSAHLTPWKFEAWMKAMRQAQWDWWEKNRWELTVGVKIDYEKVYNVLKDEAERIGLRGSTP